MRGGGQGGPRAVGEGGDGPGLPLSPWSLQGTGRPWGMSTPNGSVGTFSDVGCLHWRQTSLEAEGVVSVKCDPPLSWALLLGWLVFSAPSSDVSHPCPGAACS